MLLSNRDEIAQLPINCMALAVRITGQEDFYFGRIGFARHRVRRRRQELIVKSRAMLTLRWRHYAETGDAVRSLL